MKKGLIIGISGIAIAVGIGVYNLSPSYSVKDAHNQEMKEFRSMMRRGGSSHNFQNNDDTAYYYTSKNIQDFNNDIYIPDNIKNDFDNIAVSLNPPDMTAGFSNDALNIQISEQRKWWYMIKDYNADKEKALKEYIHNIYTFNDIISETGVSGDLPYIMFTNGKMKAYMFFDTKYKDEVKNIDTHLSVPKTVTGVCETLTPDTIGLYSCSFGY